ncbi:unnamed protein product [Thelazia callipaeda]|uniref:TROVE domain-containing protein n=1 Tax=Thelazia callipaeda TaxID=103827 RepID=A0A158RCH8_THECL|nr:unnamed protein product [Thelazia callipaeda]
MQVSYILHHLASCHPDDLRYRATIQKSLRILEEQEGYLKDFGIGKHQFYPRDVSDEEYVRRYLIIGNTHGAYYSRQRDFEETILPELGYIIARGNGLMIIKLILEFAQSGQAPKVEPLLIALAHCARFQVRDTQSKKKLPWDAKNDEEKLFPDDLCHDIRPAMESYYQKCLQHVALHCVHRICTDPIKLFKFINYCKSVSKSTALKKESKGWGRALRATVIKWYYNKSPERLAVLVTKYRNRTFFSHRDLFCLSHIRPKLTFSRENNYWKHYEDYEGIVQYVARGGERTRKMKQETFEVRQWKRSRLNPEELQRLEQGFDELNIKRNEKLKVIEAVVEKYRIKEKQKAVPVKNARDYIEAFDKFRYMNFQDEEEAVRLILQYGFEKEHVPLELLGSKKVWGAMLRNMPIRTLLANMGIMGSLELFSWNSNVFDELSETMNSIDAFFNSGDEIYTDFAGDSPAQLVVRRLSDSVKLEAAGFDPLELLFAKASYEYGQAPRGKYYWKPDVHIQKAFDSAFYKSLGGFPATGKRYLLSIDISESMDSFVNGAMLTYSQVAVAYALSLLQNEPNVNIVAFCSNLTPLEWKKDMSISECLSVAKTLKYGTVDCCHPMYWAIENAVEVDAFVIFTDINVLIKTVKPSDAIKIYREQMKIPNAKLVVVSMKDFALSMITSNDPDILIVCGVNSTIIKVINSFIDNFGVARP